MKSSTILVITEMLSLFLSFNFYILDKYLEFYLFGFMGCLFMISALFMIEKEKENDRLDKLYIKKLKGGT